MQVGDSSMLFLVFVRLVAVLIVSFMLSANLIGTLFCKVLAINCVSLPIRIIVLVFFCTVGVNLVMSVFLVSSLVISIILCS